MAITSYDDLKEEVQKWCARSDTTFSNRIDTFVALAEDRIYNGADEPGGALYSAAMRSKAMESSETIVATTGAATLPAYTLDVRSVIIPDQRHGVEYLEPEKFAVQLANLSGGSPIYYTVEGSTLKLGPTYSGNVTILIYKRFDPITSLNKNGDLIAAHGSAYLNATLFEASSFIQDVDTALGHLVRYRSQVSGINKSAKSVRHGGSNRRIRPRVAFP